MAPRPPFSYATVSSSVKSSNHNRIQCNHLTTTESFLINTYSYSTEIDLQISIRGFRYKGDIRRDSQGAVTSQFL